MTKQVNFKKLLLQKELADVPQEWLISKEEVQRGIIQRKMAVEDYKAFLRNRRHA